MVRCEHPLSAVRWTRNRLLCTACGRTLDDCPCPCHDAVTDDARTRYLLPCPTCSKSSETLAPITPLPRRVRLRDVRLGAAQGMRTDRRFGRFRPMREWT